MSAGLGSAELMLGLDDPEDLFQPKQFCDSVGFISLRNPCWESLECHLALPLVVAVDVQSRNRAALWHFLHTCYNL